MGEAPRRWVLLRGLGREAGHWADMRSTLQGAFPACEILTPDLPGAGDKWRERAPLALAAIVERLRSEIGPGPHSVIGLSLGAMVALEWAALYPEDIERVVVINTSLRSLGRPWQRMTPEAMVRGIGVARARLPRTREQAILALTSNDESRRSAALPEWLRIAEARPVSLENWLRQLVSASKANPSLSAIRAPGLVLASRADRLVRFQCSERLARRLQWPLRLHDSSGHDLPLDDPEWIVRQIVDWLN